MKLISNRIYLRNLLVSDAKTLLQAMNNEEIRYMTGTRHYLELNQIEEYIKKIKDDETREDFAICLKENNQMIGDLSILDIDYTDKKAVFRIALSSMEFTGKGYGTEAIKCILPFVFNDLQLNRLQLEVYSHNSQAKKSYEKVGFVTEGVLRETLLYNGKYSDEIVMAMLLKDYKKLYG